MSDTKNTNKTMHANNNTTVIKMNTKNVSPNMKGALISITIEKIYTTEYNNLIGMIIKKRRDQSFKEYYSYELISKKGIRKSLTIKFTVLQYSETLLLGLLKYFESVLQQLYTQYDTEYFDYNYSDNNNLLFKYFCENIVLRNPPSVNQINRQELRSKYIINNNDDNVMNNFLNENKDKEFPVEKIVEFLIRYDGYVSEELMENIESFSKTFVKKHSNNNNYSIGDLLNNDPAIIQYCVPITNFYTVKELEFIQKNKDKLSGYRTTNNCIDKPAYYWNKLYYTIFNMPVYNEESDSTTLVKNYILDESNNNKKHNNSPVEPYKNQTVELYKYINNLTVKDLKKVHSIIASLENDNISLDAIKRVCNDHINDDFVVTIHYPESKTFLHSFMNNLDACQINNNIKNIKYKIPLGLGNITNNYMFKLCIDYTQLMIDNNNVNMLKDRFGLIERIFTYNQYEWAADSPIVFNNYIVYKLLQKTDVINTMNMLYEIVSNNITLNFEQWLSYIDNYEDYKDMPVSWWTQLVS